jgi:hypothetical protein
MALKSDVVRYGDEREEDANREREVQVLYRL